MPVTQDFARDLFVITSVADGKTYIMQLPRGEYEKHVRELVLQYVTLRDTQRELLDELIAEMNAAGAEVATVLPTDSETTRAEKRTAALNAYANMAAWLNPALLNVARDDWTQHTNLETRYNASEAIKKLAEDEAAAKADFDKTAYELAESLYPTTWRIMIDIASADYAVRRSTHGTVELIDHYNTSMVLPP